MQNILIIIYVQCVPYSASASSDTIGMRMADPQDNKNWEIENNTSILPSDRGG